MISFYKEPKSIERFHMYLQLLEGGSDSHRGGELNFPISGFNPMAGEHIFERLIELRELNAEQIVEEVIAELNQNSCVKNLNSTLQVALNVSDDLKGGWTNRFTSDYDSKFKINGLVARNFCTPILWASEPFSKELIRIRAQEYIFRTIYWETNAKPITLKEHVNQELFVAENVGVKFEYKDRDFQDVQRFFEENMDTENYHVIFNFFYGDAASNSLGFPIYESIKDVTGYNYVRLLASKG